MPRQPMMPIERSTDERRKHRGSAVDDHHQAEGAGSHGAVRPIGHDGSAQHHAGGATEPLHEAESGQQGDVRGERARDAGQNADKGAGQHEWAPAEAGRTADR